VVSATRGSAYETPFTGQCRSRPAPRGTTFFEPGGAGEGFSDYGSRGRLDTAAQRRQSTGRGGPVGVRSRFASDVARETPTGRCSRRDDDTSNRPRSRRARHPCPRRNVPRRRRADTGQGPTEPSATPCHILAFPGVSLLLSMDPTGMHWVSQGLLASDSISRRVADQRWVSWGRGGTCMIVLPLRRLRPNLTSSECCSDPTLKAGRRSQPGPWPLVRAAPTARRGPCPRTQ
jgi:hypothetical protein